MCALSAPASVFDYGVFSYHNIHQRYLDCRRNKRNSINALKFEINAEEEILHLQRQLKNRYYRPSRSILFAATKPKLREIFAADFRDRLVHHVLVHKLEKIWEPCFIHDSYACRRGKGTHAAAARLQKYLRQVTRNGKVRAYYLQLDIKDFFTGIDKNILFQMMERKIDDQDLLWLTKVTLFWDCTESYVARGEQKLLFQIPPNKSLFGKNNERGLPIGNLSSQFFANVYLNELDQFIKHRLKAQYYLRYVDDFVILSRDPEELTLLRGAIEDFLMKRLKLQLHPKRRKLLPVSQGIDFLGYIVRLGYVLVRHRVVNNFKEKLRQFERVPCDPKRLRATVASYWGHFRHANSYRLKREFNQRINGLLERGKNERTKHNNSTVTNPN